jgi:CRISPR type IV-associated protein Csf3
MSPYALKVKFKLGSPVVMTFPWIFLDGVLAHLEFRRKLGDGYRLLPSKRVVSTVPEIPLVKSHGVYHASASIFSEPAVRGLTTIYKRFSSDMIGETGRGKISTGRGFFKSYNIRTPYISCDSVSFYVTLCDISKFAWFEEIISGLPGIGKETNIGFGKILSHSVEELEEDRALVSGGRAMRPIPISELRSYESCERITFRPPYWDRSSASLCSVPFSRVELR